MRQYGVQPGFRPIQMTPTVTAVSTKTLKPINCPLRIAGTYESQIESGLAKVRVIGPVVSSPPGARQHKSFSRASPGSPGSGSMATLPTAVSITSSGKLSATQLSVVTVHRMPDFFDNRNLSPDAVMQDNNDCV